MSHGNTRYGHADGLIFDRVYKVAHVIKERYKFSTHTTCGEGLHALEGLAMVPRWPTCLWCIAGRDRHEGELPWGS